MTRTSKRAWRGCSGSSHSRAGDSKRAPARPARLIGKAILYYVDSSAGARTNLGPAPSEIDRREPSPETLFPAVIPVNNPRAKARVRRSSAVEDAVGGIFSTAAASAESYNAKGSRMETRRGDCRTKTHAPDVVPTRRGDLSCSRASGPGSRVERWLNAIAPRTPHHPPALIGSARCDPRGRERRPGGRRSRTTADPPRSIACQ